MVDFAGYLLPVQYGKEGIAASHIHTRTHCSIFDVSHMLQTRVYGKDRMGFIERLTVADVLGLSDNHGTLTLFTNDKGGIIDDLIVTKTNLDYLYVVSNAGCRHKDIPHMSEAAKALRDQGLDVHLDFVEDRGLIAVQGPETVALVQSISNLDLSKMPFMTSSVGTVAGVVDCRVTRCGYTGEDGVEISIPHHDTRTVVEALLNSTAGQAKLAGLGARDSLRLEAGLCLYGNDIDDNTTPIEAGLAWTIGKRRRHSQSANFPGASIILNQLTDKPTKKRVGLLSHGGPPARQHSQVMHNGESVGEVTSGCPSPSLGQNSNISMAYVPAALSKAGTKLEVNVRNKIVEATVSKMPFVPTNYYSGNKK